MSQQLKLTKFFKCIPRPLEDGQRMEQSNIEECQVENGCTTNNNFSSLLVHPILIQPLEQRSFMPESLPNTKKRTLNVKSKISNKRIQITKSSKTLVPVSIGSDQECVPYWSASTAALSKKLWLPIETDCVDSDWSSWNGYSKSMMSSSWFKTKWKRARIQPMSLPRTYWQLQTSSWQKTTANELQKRGETASKKNKGRKLNFVDFQTNRMDWTLFKNLFNPDASSQFNTQTLYDYITATSNLKGVAVFIKPSKNKRTKTPICRIQTTSSLGELRLFIDEWLAGVIDFKTPYFRSRKHLMIVDAPDKAMLLRWLGRTRTVYNIACDILNKEYKKHNGTCDAEIKKFLRSRIYDSKWINVNYPKKIPVFEMNVPESVYDSAISDIASSYCIQLGMGKEQSDLTMKYRTKHDKWQSCVFRHRPWHKGKCYPALRRGLPAFKFRRKKNKYKLDFSKDSRLIYSRGLPAFKSRRKKNKYKLDFSKDSRLIYSAATRRFLLCVPEEIPILSIPESRSVCDTQTGSKHSQLFFDPGVRTFQTAYDPDGNLFEFGCGYEGILEKCEKIDYLTRLSRKCTHPPAPAKWKSPIRPLPLNKRARYRIRTRTIPNIRRKIENRRADCHWKVIKFLTSNSYTDFHIPTFETSELLRKNDPNQPDRIRKINSKSARMMCSWGHYQFMQRLIYKSALTGCTVHRFNEACSTIGCGVCGYKRESFSGEVFICPRCSLRIARDPHSARNMVLIQCN